jgi:hypothetical protein
VWLANNFDVNVEYGDDEIAMLQAMNIAVPNPFSPPAS